MADDEMYNLKEYTESLTKRLMQLEQDGGRLGVAEHRREERAEEVRGSLQQQLNALHDEVRAVEAALMERVKETTQLVHTFKSVVQKQEFSRLQRRIDAWKGEQYITRKEFKQLLREA